MSFVTQEQIQAAKQIDLLTYLLKNEPGELVRLSGDTYCTREHDSLKISNGKWHWFSRGIGGKTALDYLIKVQNYSFPEAVKLVLERAAARPPVSCPQKFIQPKQFMLPEANENNEKAISYLKGRGIDDEITQYCIDHRLLYESKQYHNVVFIGYDIFGTPRSAAIDKTKDR